MKKLSNITESVWVDIHKRSNGVQVRKEDDVNLLDRDGFYKYLMEHYKRTKEDLTGPYEIINGKKADYIDIPIFEDNNNIYRVFICNFDNDGIIEAEKYITIPCLQPFLGSKLFVKIRDNFKLEDKNDYCFSSVFRVWPNGIVKKTELNKFFLEVIDFIIDNVEEPFELLLKRI